MIYKLAKARNRRTNDISDSIYINDVDGNILTDHAKIKDRWQEYFDELFIVTNVRKEPDKCDETSVVAAVICGNTARMLSGKFGRSQGIRRMLSALTKNYDYCVGHCGSNKTL